jgi:hypothetical protein
LLTELDSKNKFLSPLERTSDSNRNYYNQQALAETISSQGLQELDKNNKINHHYEQPIHGVAGGLHRNQVGPDQDGNRYQKYNTASAFLLLYGA